MPRLNTIDWIAIVLLIIGGLNMGLVGLFGFDAIASMGGGTSAFVRIVFTLIGVSAIYGIFTSTKLSSVSHYSTV